MLNQLILRALIAFAMLATIPDAAGESWPSNAAYSLVALFPSGLIQILPVPFTTESACLESAFVLLAFAGAVHTACSPSLAI